MEAERKAKEKAIAKEIADAEVERKRAARRDQKERELEVQKYEHEQLMESTEVWAVLSSSRFFKR